MKKLYFAPLIIALALMLVLDPARVDATLSAISANLGTVTAGTITGITISGSTINAGTGNEVLLNNSGLTMTAGSSGNNQVKWSDGSYIYSVGNTMGISASSSVNISGMATTYAF